VPQGSERAAQVDAGDRYLHQPAVANSAWAARWERTVGARPSATAVFTARVDATCRTGGAIPPIPSSTLSRLDGCPGAAAGATMLSYRLLVGQRTVIETFDAEDDAEAIAQAHELSKAIPIDESTFAARWGYYRLERCEAHEWRYFFVWVPGEGDRHS
jgi:hypothetical protein